MFDRVADPVPAAALDAWTPVDDQIPQPWDEPGFDAWIDELAAADPERERSAGEVARTAETEQLASELAAVDVAGLSDDERMAVAIGAARWEAHYAAVRAAAVAAFAGPAPEDNSCAAAFAWTDVAAALRLGDLSARQLVARARHLHTRLQATRAALLSPSAGLDSSRELTARCIDLAPARIANRRRDSVRAQYVHELAFSSRT